MNTNTIDWNEVWKETMQLHDQLHGDAGDTDPWSTKENAQRFWNMSQQDGGKHVRKTIDSMTIGPDSRVLDIGAGPGTLVIPLAEQVSHVTAVEPSRGMAGVLQDNIEEYGLENITCVHKRWEDVTTADLDTPFDVIIASFSLHVPDIRDAIQKMVDVSVGHIYLYWFAGETSWDTQYRMIWPRLHGVEYHTGPKCDVLYNALYQMGIYPNIEVFPMDHITRFSSLDEAVEHYRHHYQVTTPVQEAVLRDFLRESVLEVDENGSKDGSGNGGTNGLVQRGRSLRAKLWWDSRDFG
ncbi:MAG: class I SAM-dependent methyltransferase [Euryarchaeota archaeon]|nr:class I SAM-dependent methyltransferase [Euryarchaeota archaeon]